jgi:hypothetical protein
MRIETATTWIFASLCLLIVGISLFIFNVPEDGKLAGVLAGMGILYFGIGAVLTVMHDYHMAKRTRAGNSENESCFHSRIVHSLSLICVNPQSIAPTAKD